MDCSTDADAGAELQPGQSVTVEVPATSANLGPGFDCFGLALDWRESIRLEVGESGYQIDVTGEAADLVPRDESHLILRSTLVGLADLGVSAPGLRLVGHNVIPHGRGLGSSSAAIVAGLLAAQTLVGHEPDAAWLLRHADAIEGHPDNVAAAIYGGFVLAYDGPHGVTAARADLASDLALMVFIPETPVATHATRNVLPEQVPHADAAANSGRAALLVHALAVGNYRLLADATRDWLHQDYRQRAMPASYDLLTDLRGHGYAAVISGAGPSVLVLGQDSAMQSLTQVVPRGFRSVRVRPGEGASAKGQTRRQRPLGVR